MKAISRAPGSCGELIQGTIKGRDMLISYPINMYSIATATFSKTKNIQSKPKVYKAVEYLINEIDKPDLLEKIDISINSNIPVGKGMASSTADMMAAVSAVANLLDYPMDEDTLARILVKVEPTDSTVFSELTLFDHGKGKIKETLGSIPDFKVLVLEGFGLVDTISFSKNKTSKSVDELYEGVKISVLNKDIKQLGGLATKSAINNQELLYKPYLYELINVSDKYNALGINIAHSGTVCGVIYDDNFDLEKFKREVNNQLNYFEKIYSVHTVKGSFELLD